MNEVLAKDEVEGNNEVRDKNEVKGNNEGWECIVERDWNSEQW